MITSGAVPAPLRPAAGPAHRRLQGMTHRVRHATKAKKSLLSEPRVFLPESFTMLGVEVDGPGPVRLPVRAKTEGVYREVVELVAAGRCPGFVDQADDRAVIGVRIIIDHTEAPRLPRNPDSERPHYLASGHAWVSSVAWAALPAVLMGWLEARR